MRSRARRCTHRRIWLTAWEASLAKSQCAQPAPCTCLVLTTTADAVGRLKRKSRSRRARLLPHQRHQFAPASPRCPLEGMRA